MWLHEEVEQVPTIEHLDVLVGNLFSVGEDVGYLNGLRLPLKTICIQPRVNFSYTEDLYYLLRKHQKVVETLKIFRQPLGDLFNVDVFQLDFLEMRELHLWGHVISSFQFLNWMSTLESIYINFTCFEKREELKEEFQKGSLQLITQDMAVAAWEFNPQSDMNKVVMTNLARLYIDYEFPVESIRMIGRWMPNLKFLQTILNKSTFPVTCELWPALRELTLLFGSDVDDAAITGGNDPATKPMSITSLKCIQRLFLKILKLIINYLF